MTRLFYDIIKLMEEENKKKVLIIGGTGFVGYYVIRALHEAGFELGVLLHKRKDDFDIPYDGYKTLREIF